MWCNRLQLNTALVYLVSSVAPDSERAAERGSRLFPACSTCSKSWHPPRLRSFDEHAHHTNGLLLFRCFATYPQHQSVRQSIRCAVASGVGDLAAGLRQYDVGWPSCMSAVYRLPSALNAAARLIYRSRKFDHVTPLLYNLH